jgi:hypothetical protein
MVTEQVTPVMDSPQKHLFEYLFTHQPIFLSSKKARCLDLVIIMEDRLKKEGGKELLALFFP